MRGRKEERRRRRGRAELGFFLVLSLLSLSVYSSSRAWGIAHTMSLVRAPHYAKRSPTESVVK